MIHHIGVFASDFGASQAFYIAALRPLGLIAHYQTEDRPEYRAYSAFVTDPDGNNIEAIHKEIPAPIARLDTPGCSYSDGSNRSTCVAARWAEWAPGHITVPVRSPSRRDRRRGCSTPESDR